jgi:hypothetical protein
MVVRRFLSWLGRQFGWRPRRRLRVPLRLRWSTALQTPHVQANVDLWMLDSSGIRVGVTFRADSGATVTRLTVSEALSHGLTVPGPRRTWREGTAAGPSVVHGHIGHLDVWLSSDDDGPPFCIPVHFPDLPGNLTPLLGLGGVVDQLTWFITGKSAKGAPFGVFILKELRRR